MIKINWILLCMLGCGICYAQPSFLLSGYVRDEVSLLGLNHVALYNTANTDSFFTDENGYFAYHTQQAGRCQLYIEKEGYKAVLYESTVQGGKTAQINIVLVKNEITLTEVKVAAGKKLKINDFDMQSIKRFPASFSDPAKLALSFVGVITQNDIRNDIQVRGNSPFGVTWQLNDIVIPNPNHLTFQTHYSGAVSMINSNVLDKSSFQISGFDAATNQTYAAAFGLQMRAGNFERYEASFRLGLLGVEATFEGPLSKKHNASVLLNYRYSTISIFEKMGFPVTGGYGTNGKIGTNYQDLAANLSFSLSKKTKAQLWLIGGTGYVTDDNGYYFSSKTSYDALMTGIRFSTTLNENTSLHHSLAYTAVNSTFASPNFNFPHQNDKNIYLQHNIRLHSFLKKRISTALTAQVGVKLNTEWVRQKKSLSDYGFDTVSNTSFPAFSSTAVYASFRYALHPKWLLTFGLNQEYYFYIRKAVLEPRFSLLHAVTKNIEIDYTAGLYSKPLPVPVYAGRQYFYFIHHPIFASNENRQLDLLRSFQIAATAKFYFPKDATWQIRLNPYFQYLYKVPIINPYLNNIAIPHYSYLSDGTTFASFILSDEGKGMNYGIDISIEKQFAKNYFILLNQSVFKSHYQTYDHKWRNTEFDQLYLTNISVGYDLIFGKKKQHLLRFSGRFIANGGRRFREIEDIVYLPDSTFRYIYSDELIGTTAPYIRGDLQLAYKFNKYHTSVEVRAEVQNFTNHRNELFRSPSAKGEYNISYQQGIIPVLSIEVYTSFRKKQTK